jgi:hypothetical protein
MQTKTRRQRRPNGYWEDVILPKAAEIVGSYDTPVTLRQLFYRLVSAGIIDNTPAEYVQLGHRTAAARRDGWFPALIDRTREIVVPPAWIDAEDARERMRDQFRIDRTEGQPVSIYLGIEKAGIVEQLRWWFGDERGIPILPLGGYHSEPTSGRSTHTRAVTIAPAYSCTRATSMPPAKTSSATSSAARTLTWQRKWR